MPQETALAQAQSVARQLTLGVFGNSTACAYAVVSLRDFYTWTELAPLAVVMVLLQITPIRMIVEHRTASPDAVWAQSVLRRVTVDSICLGLYWATGLFFYLHHIPFETTRHLLAGMFVLVAGSAGVLQALPVAFIAYACPIFVSSIGLAVVFRANDGGMLVVLVTAMMLGVIWMWCINHRNFQELVRRNRKLDELRRQADAARRAEAVFVENLNHEIRNAVTGVVGYFDIALESKLSDKEQHTLIASARDASGLLLTLLSDLLDVARLNSGRVPLTIAPFDFREVVRLSIVSTSAGIRRRPIAVESAVDPAVPQRLLGDAGRIRQIIVNLVGNAIKVMSRGTVVVQATYRFVEGRGWLDVAVIDDGPGIPPALQQVMFERFARLTEAGTPSSTPGSTGWGLGLSISASLVDLMGGSIRVESALGEGATFRIELPLVSVNDVETLLEVEPAYTAMVRKDFSILIVDDMPMNRLVLGKMLESLGCRVTLAESGIDAIRCCDHMQFHMVLMDVDMAEMDGMEATRRIRAMPAPKGSVPIIAVTGFASPEQIARILGSGMNDHALKPIRRSTVAQLLARWIPPSVQSEAIASGS